MATTDAPPDTPLSDLSSDGDEAESPGAVQGALPLDAFTTHDPFQHSELMIGEEEGSPAQDMLVSRLVAQIADLEQQLYAGALDAPGGPVVASMSGASQVPPASFEPRPSLREAPLTPATAAVLLIDVQNYSLSPRGAIQRSLAATARGGRQQYLFERVERCLEAWNGLGALAAEKGIQMVRSVVQSGTPDGRDRSRGHVAAGYNVPPGCWDGQALEGLTVRPGDLVLRHTTSSVFSGGGLDSALRGMGVTQLIVCGGMTDESVDHTTRDASDRGYSVTLVPDACVCRSAARQEAAVAMVSGYCRLRTYEQIAGELRALSSATSSCATTTATTTTTPAAGSGGKMDAILNRVMQPQKWR